VTHAPLASIPKFYYRIIVAGLCIYRVYRSYRGKETELSEQGHACRVLQIPSRGHVQLYIPCDAYVYRPSSNPK
jgi:hypothetical protein